MDNVNVNNRRDNVKLDIQVDEDDAIFATDGDDQNNDLRRDTRDLLRERDREHSRDPERDRDDHRALTLDHSQGGKGPGNDLEIPSLRRGKSRRRLSQ